MLKRLLKKLKDTTNFKSYFFQNLYVEKIVY